MNLRNSVWVKAKDRCSVYFFKKPIEQFSISKFNMMADTLDFIPSVFIFVCFAVHSVFHPVPLKFPVLCILLGVTILLPSLLILEN